MEYMFRAQYLYTPSIVVKLGVKMLEDFHQANIHNPKAKAFFQGHSGGCTEALHISNCLSPEVRSRVVYLGIAPSALLGEEVFHKVRQVGVKGDMVVKYAIYNDFVHAINSKTFETKPIELLDPMPGEDKHSVRSGVFKSVIIEEIKDYLRKQACE
jgi:hypothetical protein